MPLARRLWRRLRAAVSGIHGADRRERLAGGLSRLPLARRLRMMELRRLKPLRATSGTPVARRYWAEFLEANRADIRGHALEIGDTRTVRHYGGAAIAQADAIDFAAHSPAVTLVADLARADHLPSDRFDCFVNQFTTHVIFDIEAALWHSIRMLKPGGVLLANFLCVEYCLPRGIDMGTGGVMHSHWFFTPLQVHNLFRRLGLGDGDYRLTTRGNLFTRVAYQMNLPAEELSEGELSTDDPAYPLMICARAVKPTGWNAPRPANRDPWLPSAESYRWTPERGHEAV
jgi:SAM-dependent methyltransferase